MEIVRHSMVKKFVFFTSPTEALIFIGSGNVKVPVTQLEKPTPKTEALQSESNNPPPLRIRLKGFLVFLFMNNYS